ncbi:MAG: hypothetical protein QOJ92_2038 [Frankiales bacterium]|nr:hypothetical protein [Frankiales bacterium]
MRKHSKKLTAVVAGTAAAVALSGVAYAYWTTTGSGASGAGSTGTSSALTLHATTDASQLTPGGTTSVVSFTADNPNTGHQYVTSVSLASVEAWTDAARTISAATCDVTKFSMATVTENQDIPSGNGTALTNSGELKLNNAAVSQDGCKSVFLTLHLTSN